MALPLSFQQQGFMTPKAKRRRLTVNSDGETNTGKTEFMMSAPSPGIIVTIDRGWEACYQSEEPPESRQPDWAILPIEPPMISAGTQNEFIKYWIDIRDTLYRAAANKDALTVCLDGDSDSWEIQRMATFGRAEQVPPLMYKTANAERRAFIAKLHDAGKNLVFSNKVKDGYEDTVNEKGQTVSVKSGQIERQGFKDTKYLWQVSIRHLRKDGQTIEITKGPRAGTVVRTPPSFGLEIIECKPKMSLNGQQLWDGDCNFQGLIKAIYPNSPLSEWGY